MRKYFPEAAFYDENGGKVSLVDSSTEGNSHGSFVEDCRDSKLKINDDRKIVIRFSALKDIQMVLLFVRANTVRSEDEKEFDRSQFRFLNEDTN